MQDSLSGSGVCVKPVPAGCVVDFAKIVSRLKLLKRTGWVRSGISGAESVADHMYRMSMLALMITDETVDKDRLTKICLVHDLAESVVGDITPYCGVSKEEKRHLEETALRKILSDLQTPHVEQELLSLWLDYEKGDSVEADIAMQLDKFEMISQAFEYEQAQGAVLDDFFASTVDSFRHFEVLSWAEELRGRRDRWLAHKQEDST